jgi:predicted permease
VRGSSIAADLGEEYRHRPSGVLRDVWYTWEALKLTSRYLMTDQGGGKMDRSLGHVRVALRRVLREPGYSLLSIGTMALGIAAAVAIFSVVHAVLLAPLPYRDPGRLVAVFESIRGAERNVANPGNVRAWRDRVDAFAGVASVTMPQPMVVTDPGEPREVLAGVTTPDFFRVLGLDPLLGPGFDESDGRAAVEAVLTHRAWQEIFAGAEDVVGRGLTVNGMAGVVVGVLPDGFVPFADGAELFVARPLELLGDQTSTGRFLHTVARLDEGVELSTAVDQLEGVMAGLREAYPDFNAGAGVTAVPLQEHVVGDVRAGLWLLLAAVGLLLLIACANVANLGLARATDRQREMAVRSSLGASGGTLAAQLLVESALHAAAGGALGLAAAFAGTRLLATRMPDVFALPRVEQAGVNGTVLLFALGVTLSTAVLVGLVPALQARRVAPARTLNAEGRGPGRGSTRLRDALVVAEVAVSVVLLVGAGLLGRSFATLLAVDPGVEVENVVTARVSLTGSRYDGTDPDVRFFHDLAERLAELPGVEASGGVSFLPMGGMNSRTSFYAADRPAPQPEEWASADIRNVVGDYFGAMGIELLRGRLFEPDDVEGGPAVVVVSRALAEQQWPGEDPLGKPVAINWRDLEPWTVVGVVEDVHHAGLGQDPHPTVYHHYPQAPYFGFMSLALRTRGETAAAVEGLRRAVAELDPGLPVSRVRVMDDVVGGTLARPRMTTLLMGIFAGVAALLAAVGLYGVLSYAVARRVREFGVRMAVGAGRGDVLRLVAARGLALAGLGLVLGLGGAFAAAGALDSLLFGITARDPASFVASGALLVAVAAGASLLPAWRATRVPPVEALRSE